MKTFFLLIVVAVLAAPVLAAHADTLNPECSNQAIPQVQTLQQVKYPWRLGSTLLVRQLVCDYKAM